MIWNAMVVVLALAALLYVTAPIRTGRNRTRSETDVPSDIAELEAQKRASLQAILDVREDAELGKLSPEELADLRATYEAEALLTLRRLDAVGAPSAVDDPLEAEIAAARQRLTCSSCGALKEVEGTCSNCGAS